MEDYSSLSPTLCLFVFIHSIVSHNLPQSTIPSLHLVQFLSRPFSRKTFPDPSTTVNWKYRWLGVVFRKRSPSVSSRYLSSAGTWVHSLSLYVCEISSHRSVPLPGQASSKVGVLYTMHNRGKLSTTSTLSSLQFQCTLPVSRSFPVVNDQRSGTIYILEQYWVPNHGEYHF